MTRLATPRFGLDAAGPIPISAQKAIGATFDFRYLSRYTWKVIQPGEYYNLIASGIDVGIVFEDDVATAKGGYTKGVADAEWCIAQGAARGLPKDFPCIWAVDYDTAGYCSVLEPYAKGFKSRIPRSGPYGDYYVVEYFGVRGYLTWQTYAWSYGRLSKYAMCYQYSNGHNVGGADTDYNRLFDTAVLIDGEQPPPPPPLPGGKKMAALTALRNENGNTDLFAMAEPASGKTCGEVFELYKSDGAWVGVAGVTKYAWRSVGNPEEIARRLEAAGK